MRVVAAGIVGGIVMFIFQAVWWMGIPLPGKEPAVLPAGEAIMSALGAENAESGMYHYPGMIDDDMEKTMAAMAEGPVVSLMVFHPDGIDAMSAMTFLKSLLFDILCALIVAFVISRMQPSGGYGSRVGIALLFGVFAAVFGPIMNMNWWHFPMDFALVAAAERVIGWTIVGCAIAAIVNPVLRTEH